MGGRKDLLMVTQLINRKLKIQTRQSAPLRVFSTVWNRQQVSCSFTLCSLQCNVVLCIQLGPWSLPPQTPPVKGHGSPCSQLLWLLILSFSGLYSDTSQMSSVNLQLQAQKPEVAHFSILLQSKILGP